MPQSLRLEFCLNCLMLEGIDTAQAFRAVGEALNAENLSGQVTVAGAACLEACEAPAVMCLQAQDEAVYVFHGVRPAPDAGDIAATCRTYLNSANGWIEDARPCGRLRLCLRARVPAGAAIAAD